MPSPAPSSRRGWGPSGSGDPGAGGVRARQPRSSRRERGSQLPLRPRRGRRCGRGGSGDPGAGGGRRQGSCGHHGVGVGLERAPRCQVLPQCIRPGARQPATRLAALEAAGPSPPRSRGGHRLVGDAHPMAVVVGKEHTGPPPPVLPSAGVGVATD